MKIGNWSLNDTKLRIKQLQYEAESWLRALDFIKQENVYLKNRLAVVIQSDIDKYALEQAEDFQTHFLNKDSIIDLLKNDIYNYQVTIAALIRQREPISDEILERQKNFREDMEKLTKEFSRLRHAFNSYIDEMTHLG